MWVDRALAISTVLITRVAAGLDSSVGADAGDLSCGLEGVGGDTLAVATVVTLVHLTGAAAVLGQTATLVRPAGTLQTCAPVQTVALAATVLALVSQEVSRASAGGLVASVDRAVPSILTVVLTGV